MAVPQVAGGSHRSDDDSLLMVVKSPDGGSTGCELYIYFHGQ